ncbi:MAG: AAA family ATPase [Saprospiraceae bacterium]
MPIVAVANLKGGVGKSTISQNLAVSIRQTGFTVCLIDTDAEQRSTLEWSERRQAAGLDLVTVQLVDEESMASKVNQAADQFDYVIIDGSPALSEITTKIVLLADYVIVPVMPSGNDFGALEKFLTRYNDTRAIQKRHGIHTAGLGVLLNEYDPKAIVNRTIYQAIDQLEVPVLQSRVANRVAYKEANLTGAGVTEMQDRKASGEILALREEVFAHLAQTVA